jgi:hypothetical protein
MFALRNRNFIAVLFSNLGRPPSDGGPPSYGGLTESSFATPTQILVAHLALTGFGLC